MSDHYVNHNSQSKEGNVQENSFIDELYVNQHLRFQSPKEKKKSWKDNNVFTVIPYSNQKCISVPWACSFKETSNGAKPKAHLSVVQGFEEHALTSFEKQ